MAAYFHNYNISENNDWSFNIVYKKKQFTYWGLTNI